MSSIKNLNTNNDEGLFNTVIKQDYCIGCGVCTAVNNSPFDVSMDKFGNFKAEKIKEFDNTSSVANKVCPFSDGSKNEEELGEIYYPNNTKSSYIGNYIKNFAGKVVVNNFRQLGSSGGVAKWIGAKLLETNEIDYFIQLVSNETNDSQELLFDFAVFSNSADVLQGSKSAYYPVTLKEILKVIKSKDGRYAITGVPCYIKALRLLALEDNLVRERIKYTIGIVCGGMKSANQSKMIGWELGVHPSDLVKIDFRRKDDSRSARDKVYQVWSKNDNIERYKFSNQIFGTDYGVGYFKPKACDYCDDVVGELADISIGDAWLPGFVNDSHGNSVVIIRNERVMSIISGGIANKELDFQEIKEEDVVKSQDAGFRHRREGLSYRLFKKNIEKKWAPEKRVKPSDAISSRRKQIYDLREKIAAKSHQVAYEALEKNNYNIYYRKLYLISMVYYAKRDNISLLWMFLKRVKKLIKKRVF